MGCYSQSSHRKIQAQGWYEWSCTHPEKRLIKDFDLWWNIKDWMESLPIQSQWIHSLVSHSSNIHMDQIDNHQSSCMVRFDQCQRPKHKNMPFVNKLKFFLQEWKKFVTCTLVASGPVLTRFLVNKAITLGSKSVINISMVWSGSVSSLPDRYLSRGFKAYKYQQSLKLSWN